MIGKTLAHYEITAILGRGGMGEVYRARDTKLDREVALKLLPPELAEDPERIARLRREAKTLASIHHPRVASLFGIEDAEGATFLVMELVEGPTLAERLQAGSVGLDDAIHFARQIAEGLREAHARGVMHRDLKPANIKVTPGDEVKILDFGLARAYQTETASGDLANSPTITAAMTQAGMILGTAAYMSPEQAKGKSIDARSDIWSYGVILFEMLCGKQLFVGETVSETMAEVMKGEIEWSRLPSNTPPWLLRLLRRCLDRDPQTRLQDIGEARIALERGEESADEEAVVTGDIGRTRRFAPWLPVAAALFLLAPVLVWFGLRESVTPEPSIKFQIRNPQSSNLRMDEGRFLALSPDGKRIATIGANDDGPLLVLRSLDSFEWTELPGTDDAQMPMFSPDGKWLAFSRGQNFFKFNLHGGAPIQLGRSPAYTQSSHWGDDGYIYFTSNKQISRIPDGGGETEMVFEDPKLRSLASPWVLPGGAALLLHSGDEGTTLSQLHVLDLETRTLHDLGLTGAEPRYMRGGILLFAQSQQLMAVRFDPKSLEVRGTPIPVSDRVWLNGGVMHLDVAQNGTVAYLPDSAKLAPELNVVDRNGESRPLLANVPTFDTCSDPRLSPDGSRLMLVVNRFQLWMIDLLTETPTMLSEDGFYPLWSPDGRTVTYGSTRDRSFDIYQVPTNLSQPETRILDWENNLRTAAMAPDGTLVFREEIPGKGMDLHLYPPGDPEGITSLLAGPDDELSPAISPDGRWLAYLSDVSGQDEVYLTSFPRPGGRVKISSNRGDSPAWSKDGSEIFYFAGDAMMAAQIQTEPEVRVLSRQELFRGSYLQYRWHRQYEVMPDGEHFLLIRNAPRATIEVVTHWFDELDRALQDVE